MSLERTSTPVWVPLMTPEQVADLITMLSSMDTRFRLTDEAMVVSRNAIWWKILGEVNPVYARKYVERAYAEPRDYQLQPAEILTAWRADVKTLQERADREQRLADNEHAKVNAGPQERFMRIAGTPPPALRDFMVTNTAEWKAFYKKHPSITVTSESARAALRRATNRAVDELSAQRPGRSVSAREVRERRCVFHMICACEHLACRQGMLDAEDTIASSLGISYPSVQRCPSCNDAVLMAEERGMTKKPNKGFKRRA